VDVKARILGAAGELLAASSDGDVSTRAVCDAAGVGPPALYRQFGDKAGLLAAVVDSAYEQYLASKRAMQMSGDPVADLRTGWDNHVAFALEHPNVYRLMWAPGLAAPPEAAAEAHRMLQAVLERCASAGRLTVSPPTATTMIMSSNVGVALSLVSRAALFPDLSVSGRVRDAVLAAVTTVADDDDAGAAQTTGAASAVGTAATALGARLRGAPPAALNVHERALLLHWLARIADLSEVPDPWAAAPAPAGTGQ